MTDEASMIVTIRKDGVSSFKVTVTEQAKKLGLKEGDQVRVTLTRI